MMTDKTRKILTWTLGSIGLGIAIAATVYLLIFDESSWTRIAMISGFAIALLGMVIAPISKKEIENESACDIFSTAIVWSILAGSWILCIDNFSPLVIAILICDIILLVVDCVLAYKKKEMAKTLIAESKETAGQDDEDKDVNDIDWENLSSN